MDGQPTKLKRGIRQQFDGVVERVSGSLWRALTGWVCLHLVDEARQTRMQVTWKVAKGEDPPPVGTRVHVLVSAKVRR